MNGMQSRFSTNKYIAIGKYMLGLQCENHDASCPKYNIVTPHDSAFITS